VSMDFLEKTLLQKERNKPVTSIDFHRRTKLAVCYDRRSDIQVSFTGDTT
jgi:hypothetical protein